MSSGSYEKPEINDFGSLWENTFVNPGGNIKLNGANFDAHIELGS